MIQLRRKKQQGLNRELVYASHHHLIPLYAISGTLLVGFIVVACFVAALWQNMETDSIKPAVDASIAATENQFVGTALSPAEKKQYIYPANIRFNLSSPYNTLRYSYDPGMAATSTSATIAITTSSILQKLEQPLRDHPNKSVDYLPGLQNCSRVYVIRFQPGVIPYGGFTPLKELPLKDGRTAYIHKNTNCVPDSTQAMDNLDDIEATVLSIESY